VSKKKSLVPLFGVAFVVAILSTGIFYGLLVGKLNSASVADGAASRLLIAAKAIPAGTVLKAEHFQEVPVTTLPAGAVAKQEDALGKTLVEPLAASELLTFAKIGAKSGGSVESGSMGIPEGMRAVSILAQDSAGIVAILKPGHRVDIQVVGTPQGQYGAEPQLRTVLENVQVLAVPREPSMQRGGGQIVTLLATPRHATILGLADSTAKIRIALRNPIDQKQEGVATVGLSSLFRQGAVTPVPSRPSSPPARPTLPQQVQLLVRVAAATPDSVHELESQLLGSSSSDSLQVSAFRPDAAVESTVSRMLVVTTSSLTAGQKRETTSTWSLEDRGKDCGLRIQFNPAVQSGGKLLVRVFPEVTTPAHSGLSRRRLDTEIEVADGQSFLVRGLANSETRSLLWEKLFPTRVEGLESRELLVVVTPKVLRTTVAAAPVHPPTL